MREHKEVELRYDLHDTQVMVCAASVPSILTDNFDWQTSRDFIQGVLGNKEVMC